MSDPTETPEAVDGSPPDDAVDAAADDAAVIDVDATEAADGSSESSDDPADTGAGIDADADSGDDVAGDGSDADEPELGASTIVDDGSVGAFDAMALERDQYLDALRRLQADFENFRKQALKRQGDAIEHATGRLVEEILPVLDACDAGLEHGDEGVTAIFTALLGVLEKNGMERLDPMGEEFDPNAHEAVMHEPGDDGADGPVVVEVMRPGYRWKERTLRAAMVKVKG